METTSTPGFNRRIAIWFDTNRTGMKVAYYWSGSRAIRMSIFDANLVLAADQADRLNGHPLTGKGF